MAPEIACGHQPLVTFKADIYSFGVTVFEIFSDLNTPWENILPIFTDELLKTALRRGSRPNVEELLDLYPHSKVREIIDVIEECWDQNEEERPNMSRVSQNPTSHCDITLYCL